MAKNFISIIAGYVMMAVLMFAGFTAAYALLGADGAFRPASFETSSTWLVVSVAVSFLAAVAGGWLCARLACNKNMVYVLAAVIIVLGLISAFPVLTAGDSDQNPVRSGPVSNLEAMQKAKQPLWIVLAMPLLGAAGVVLGGKRKKPLPDQPASTQ